VINHNQLCQVWLLIMNNNFDKIASGSIRKVRDIPKFTKVNVYQYKELGADYFAGNNYSSINKKFSRLDNILKKLPAVNEYGVFKDDSHYLKAVDALIASTFETEHRTAILRTEVISKFSKVENFLDIGVGNGDLTAFFAPFFGYITVVDNMNLALDRLPDEYGSSNSPVEKIFGSILDDALPIFQKSYDLILVSHVLYYIPDNFKQDLLKKLYGLLSDQGLMVVIYNSGGDRAELIKNFNPNYTESSNIEMSFSTDYPKVYSYKSFEFLNAPDVDSMMKIVSVCLHDGGAVAKEEDLRSYLKSNYCDNICQLSMDQHIYVIGKTDTVIHE
jgi:SAM-dependent methyltransferase